VKSFTLIELLLVIAIIGIISAVTLPSLVGSIRGNRLRLSARSVVMAGRYARSMAVMKQIDMVLRFDLDAGKMTVAGVGVGPRPSEDEEPPADETRNEADAEGAAPAAVTRAVGPAGAEELSRKLDRVRLTRVELRGADEEAHTSGTCTILYRSNGTCDPYTVEIEDLDGAGMTINVDALSAADIEARP